MKKLLAIAILLTLNSVQAREQYPGQWAQVDPVVSEWYRELKQPDNPQMSCCGQSDSYYADRVYYKDGKNIAVITDTRDDAPLQRPHVSPGTEFVIPDHKMKWDDGNPTGHSVIFLSNVGADGNRDVYCFVDGRVF